MEIIKSYQKAKHRPNASTPHVLFLLDFLSLVRHEKCIVVEVVVLVVLVVVVVVVGVEQSQHLSGARAYPMAVK